MALPTAEDRAEMEEKAGSSGSIELSLSDLGLENEPAPPSPPPPEPAPEPEPDPEPTAGGRTGPSVTASASEPTGLPSPEQRQAIEKKAGTSSTSSPQTSSAEPEPEPEPDPEPNTREESGTNTNTMAITDPAEELREVSGASDAATGTHILASGGGILEASQTISGMREASPDIGDVRNLLESGYTDAPSDILTKMTGAPDPNPGHTSPEEAQASASTSSSGASDPVAQAGQAVQGAVPGFGFAGGNGSSSAMITTIALVGAAFFAGLALIGIVDPGD